MHRVARKRSFPKRCCIELVGLGKERKKGETKNKITLFRRRISRVFLSLSKERKKQRQLFFPHRFVLIILVSQVRSFRAGFLIKSLAQKAGERRAAEEPGNL